MTSSPSPPIAPGRPKLAVAIAALLLVGVSRIGFAEFHADKLNGQSSRTLIATVGNPDPAVLHRVHDTLAPGQETAAFYRGTRVERLAALDAVAKTRQAVFDVLPILAALMGANDRQTASRASLALNEILRRVADDVEGMGELIPGQASQLISQLVPLAIDPRLDVDIRGVALQGILVLEPRTGRQDRPWMESLLKDDDPAIRRIAVGMLTPPLPSLLLSVLASIAQEDPDLLTKGNAAGMLCENALEHGVTDPSDDLAAILKGTLGNPEAPADALGGTLACLLRMEGTNRNTLVDVALKHPDPSVEAYWNTINGR